MSLPLVRAPRPPPLPLLSTLLFLTQSSHPHHTAGPLSYFQSQSNFIALTLSLSVSLHLTLSFSLTMEPYIEQTLTSQSTFMTHTLIVIRWGGTGKIDVKVT